jgi:hypothetical protein
VLSDLEVVFATDMSDVLDAALQPATQTIPFVPPAVAKTPELETLDT